MIKFGLIRGRHDLPVKKYIFESVENPFGFNAMQKTIAKALNQYKGRNIIVYATGLTTATIAVINYCYDNNIGLTVRHFNKETGLYDQDQKIGRM